VTIGPVKRPVLRFPSGNYSKTGKELWAVKLDYAANAIPITYQGKKGKPQYVAVMSSGGASVGASPNGQALIVFSLP
jgi:glucose dehydrogenase